MNQPVCHKNLTLSPDVAQILYDKPDGLKTGSTDAIISPQYCTVQQIVDDPLFCFTESMLRYYILHAHSNGLRKAIRKVGRKVLLRRDLLVSWLEEKAMKGGR